MFVRDTLTATQTPAFKNYFKKAKEIHRHKTRYTSKDTVEIPQPTTETCGRYSMVRFQVATTWNNVQNALPIDMLSRYYKVKQNLTNQITFMRTYNNWQKPAFIITSNFFGGVRGWGGVVVVLGQMNICI